MIKDVEKILSASATGLKYRKKETMQGLYFKEMLSRSTNSKNNNNNNNANTYTNKQKKKKIEEKKIDTTRNDVDHNNVEGTLLDKFC